MSNNEENALVNTGPPTGTSEHLGGRPALGGGAQGLPKQTLSKPSAVDPGLSTATETITQENRGLRGKGDPTKLLSPSHRNLNKVANDDGNVTHSERRNLHHSGTRPMEIVNNHDNRSETSEETGFPPDVLGSQVMIPSLGALAEALRLKEHAKREAKEQQAPNATKKAKGQEQNKLTRLQERTNNGKISNGPNTKTSTNCFVEKKTGQYTLS